MKFCPACQEVVMLKYLDKSTALEIDSCPECFGLWFDREELKLLFESPKLSKQILEEGAAQHVLPQETDVGRSAESRSCPVCQDSDLFPSMLGQTQVDYCLQCHGIWFDRSELEALVRAFRNGERGNLLIVNQLSEGLGTTANPNPRAAEFWELLDRYSQLTNEPK